MAAPGDLAGIPLLRSYRADEWPRWFAAARSPCPALTGPVFDSSVTMAVAAMGGAAVALLAAAMFTHALSGGALVQPFDVLETGSCWLTRLKTRVPSQAMTAFRDWLIAVAYGSRTYHRNDLNVGVI
jgi:LysR family transcriptional regulator, regulator of gene expression of beta-lactamase